MSLPNLSTIQKQISILLTISKYPFNDFTPTQVQSVLTTFTECGYAAALKMVDTVAERNAELAKDGRFPAGGAQH